MNDEITSNIANSSEDSNTENETLNYNFQSIPIVSIVPTDYNLTPIIFTISEENNLTRAKSEENNLTKANIEINNNYTYGFKEFHQLCLRKAIKHPSSLNYYIKLKKSNTSDFKQASPEVKYYIDSYISQNYFKLTGIAKSLEGSNLDVLPNESIFKIASYLKLNDVKPQNYFKLTGIAKSLEGSNLDVLPNKLIFKIASYLKLNDVKPQNYFKLTGIAKSLKGSNLDVLPNKLIFKIASYLKLNDVKHTSVSIEEINPSNVEHTTLASQNSKSNEFFLKNIVSSPASLAYYYTIKKSNNSDYERAAPEVKDYIDSYTHYIDDCKNYVDSYVSKNYFEFTGIAKSLKGSDLGVLPEKLIFKIASYLDFSDVKHVSVSKVDTNSYDAEHTTLTGQDSESSDN